MEPNNSYQPAPSGIDYLYQIAPPTKPTGSGKKTKIIIGIMLGIGLLLTSLIVVLIMQTPKTGGASLLSLTVRLQEMQTLSQKFTGKLHSSALQDANSSLSAVLLTANKSIADPLAKSGFDLKKRAKEITALQDKKIETKLDEAYLNNQLDDVYAREMYFLIEDTMVMMSRLHDNTNVPEMKNFLKKTYDDFNNLKKQLSSLTAANPTETNSDLSNQ